MTAEAAKQLCQNSKFGTAHVKQVIGLIKKNKVANPGHSLEAIINAMFVFIDSVTETNFKSFMKNFIKE